MTRYPHKPIYHGQIGKGTSDYACFLPIGEGSSGPPKGADGYHEGGPGRSTVASRTQARTAPGLTSRQPYPP